MAENSKIEWTDATWNPVTGCSVVSPGCSNCYAMRLAGTRLRRHPSRAGLTDPGRAGPVWNGKVRLNEGWLDQPLRWKRPRRIFVCAHGDLFHEAVADAWIDQVFAVIALCPHHVFQVLTKRPARMRKLLSRMTRALIATQAQLATQGRCLSYERTLIDDWPALAGAVTNPSFDIRSFKCWPLPNCWFGVSAEDQRRAEERIPLLLDMPAAVRFVSAEPLLGPIDLARVCLIPKIGGSARAGIHIDALAGRYVESGLPFIGYWHVDGPLPDRPDRRLDWVIAGGESGPGARPCHPDWVRALRDQCAAAGVAFFMKQMAKKAPIPDDLMIREFPDA